MYEIKSIISFIIDLMVYKLYSLDINETIFIEPGFITKLNYFGLYEPNSRE